MTISINNTPQYMNNQPRDEIDTSTRKNGMNTQDSVNTDHAVSQTLNCLSTLDKKVILIGN